MTVSIAKQSEKSVGHFCDVSNSFTNQRLRVLAVFKAKLIGNDNALLMHKSLDHWKCTWKLCKCWTLCLAREN